MTFRTGKTRPEGAGSTGKGGRARAKSGLACLAAGLALAFLGGCDNLFSGEDLKAKIKDEVTVTNAEEVDVTISATPSSGGTLSLNGIVTKKVGVGFSLTATPFGTYSFGGWTALGGGEVVFSNAGASTTTVTIAKQASDIAIQATFVPRPTVVDYSPAGTGVYRNQPIYVQFSKDMLSTAFDASTIKVVAKPNGVAGAASSDIFPDYDLTTMADGFMLTPTAYPEANNRITVTVSQEVTDLSGKAMAEDFQWYFVTGSELDTTVPEIDSIAVRKGHDTPVPAVQLLSSAWATNTTELTIDTVVDTSSATIMTQAIEITETDALAGIPVTHVYGYDASGSQQYDLQTAGSGDKTLRIRVMNSVGTWSTFSYIGVALDTDTPPAPGTPTKATIPADYITAADYAGTVVFSVPLDPGMPVGDTIELLYNGAPFSTPQTREVLAGEAGSSVSMSVPGSLFSGADGAKTVAARSSDAAGNVSAASAALPLAKDTTPPGSVTAQAAAAKAGGTVLLTWTEPADADYAKVRISWTGGNTTVAKGTTSYTTGALTNATAYTFTFKTEDSLGNVQASGVTAGATADSAAPASVTGQTATAQAGGTILLSWTEPATSDYKQVNISWTGGGSAIVPKNTTSYVASGLIIGNSYTFTFKTEDTIGNIEGTGATANAVADGTPPASVTGQGAAAKAGGTVLLSWTEPADADYKQVRIGWNGGGSATVPKGTTSYTTGALTNGVEYTFTFKTEDNAGNVETVGVTAAATADATAPGSVSGQSAAAKAGGTILLSWTEPADADYKQVRISWGGGGNAIVAKGTTSYTTGALANGTVYTFAFKTEDEAGNVQATSVTAGATADSLAPASVTSQTATAQAGGTILLSWTEPATSDYKQVNISWTGGGSAIVPKGTTSYIASGLTSGTLYEFTFKTEDTAGNIQSAGVTKTATADGTPPASVTGQGATPKAGGTVLLSWTEPADADYKQVRIGWDGGGSATVPKGTTSYTTGALTNGVEYTFTFKTEDNAGNVETVGVTAAATADATAPGSVSGQSAAAKAGGTILLSWTEPADADYKQVRISWGGGGNAIVAKGTTSYTTIALANGTAYTFAFKTEDEAGNVQATGLTADATADSLAPASVTSQTATAQAGGTILLSWTEPATSDYKQVNISWSGGEASVPKGTTSYIASGLTSGTLYEFTFKTEDTAGNIQSAGVTKTATADGTPPASVTGQGATPKAGGTVLLSWTEPADADYKQVRIGWDGGGSATVPKGTTSYTTGALTDGVEYTFTFKTEDTLGNVESAGVQATAIADAAAPGDVAILGAATPAGGKVVLTWTDPGDADFKQVRITWNTGSATVAAGTGTYATPVLSETSYAFDLKTEDEAGNVQDAGQSVSATPLAAAVAITSMSVNASSGPKVTYAATGSYDRFYYWAGDSAMPDGAAYTTSIASPVNLSALLGGNKTFGFCLGDASGSLSVSYVFAWSGTSYDAGTAKSLSSSGAWNTGTRWSTAGDVSGSSSPGLYAMLDSARPAAARPEAGSLSAAAKDGEAAAEGAASLGSAGSTVAWPAAFAARPAITPTAEGLPPQAARDFDSAAKDMAEDLAKAVVPEMATTRSLAVGPGKKGDGTSSTGGAGDGTVPIALASLSLPATVPPAPSAPMPVAPTPRQGGEPAIPAPRLALAPAVSDWKRRGSLVGRQEE